MIAARPWWPVVTVLMLLAGSNLMSNRVVGDIGYVPWNLMIAVILIGIAWRVDALPAEVLGVARADLGRGLLIGVVIAASAPASANCCIRRWCGSHSAR